MSFLNKQTLQENLNNPKNIFGDFCSVENILNPKFNEEKEYEKILEELEIMDDFEGKVAKKIYFFRHPEADKSVENGDLTEKGKKDLEQKAEILKDYFKNSKIILRYAGISKNRDIVSRIAKTAEILYKNLGKNIVGIVQEDGLDTREKVEFKGENSVLDKDNALKKQEQETLEFYKELFEKFKNNDLEISKNDSEIHIIHSTNMDVIHRIITEEYHPKETGYHKLQMGEGFEVEISSFGEILKEKKEFIHLNSENYLEIIEELENVENEKISKAIEYFKNGKIKIIDLQNVINKQILENNEFIKNFKNSDNLDLRKLAFINILAGEDFFDREVEELILECNLDLEIIDLLKYFSDIFENYDYSLNYETISAIYNDFDVKKDKLLKFIKVIGKLNSTKILNLKYLSELNSFFDFLKEKDNEFDFETYKSIISDSVIEKGYSLVFKENLDDFVNFLGLDNSKKEHTFIIKTNIFNDGMYEGISGDINLFNLENNENIELSYDIKNIIKNYIETEVESERYHLSFPYYIVLKFIGNRLVLEKGNIVYGDTDLRYKDFIKLEELFQDGIFKGQITQDFKDFFNKNKSTQYFQRHLENIVGMEVQKIYMKLLELLRKGNKSIDSYMIANQDNLDYLLLLEPLLENVSKYKESVDKSDLKKLKKDFYLKINFYNKLILQYLYPDYQKDSFIKIQMIEMIKCINAYIK